MSVVEDVRQVLQDFLAPELRALAVKFETVDRRLDTVDKRLDTVESKLETLTTRMDAFETNTTIRFAAVDSRFDRMEEKMAARQEILLIQFESIKNLLDVDNRLRRLEARDPAKTLPQSA